MKKPHVIVLGGGISGLSAAMHLAKNSEIQVTLIESKGQVGGWAKTFTSGDFSFEGGPRTIRSNHANELMELAELASCKEKLISSSDKAIKRYIGKNNFLWGILPGPKALFKSCIIRRFIPFYIRELFIRKKVEDETLYDFAKRRFGKPVAETLIDPITHGIYACSPKELSVDAAFPILKEWERKYGSVVMGLLRNPPKKGEKLLSFTGGLSTFTKAMHNHLGDIVHTKESVIKIENGKVTTSKKTYTADAIICALPLPASASLLGDQIHELNEIQSSSLTVVNLGWKKEFPRKNGFGFLVPSSVKSPLMGCIFDSDIFETDQGQTKFTLMMRGKHKDAKVAMQELKRFVKFPENPDEVHVEYLHNPIPKYAIGHIEKVKAIRAKLPKGIFLSGNYLDGASLNACAKSGKEAAKNVTSFLEHLLQS